MQITPFLAHYQSVYTNFYFSSFSRISCTPKTILLQRKNHTFTRRICNTQITNTLRTLRECVSNGLQMCPQRFTNVWRTRIHGHDKSTPTAANSLPFRCERIVNNATNTHEITTKHSDRRRGPIHRARILT